MKPIEQDNHLDNEKQLKSRRNFKRILVFVLLNVVSIALVIIFTKNDQTFGALLSIKPQFLLLTAAIWFCSISCDSIGMIFFVRGTGEKVKLGESYKLSLIRIFFNVITPFSAGGQPFTVYMLTQMGISAGKSSSIIITRLISLTLCSFLGAIYSFFFFGREISSIPVLSWAFLATAILIIVFSAIAVAGLLYPGFMILITDLVSRLLVRFRIIKNKKTFRHAAVRQVINARSSFKNYFSKPPGALIGGMLGNAAMYIAQVSTLYCILLGLGISITYARGFASCALLIFLFSFMPTPGGSGLGDILFVIIFSGGSTVPRNLLGIAVVLWRTFYQYLSAILGTIFSARFFSRAIIKKD